MKGININGANLPSVRMLRYSLNIILTLVMVLSSFGVALAADPLDERFADDPYESWGEAFLDFVPPNPDLLTLEQPDGSTLEAYLTPMETGGQMETTDGYTIVQNEEGWWTYAQPGDGITNPADQAVPSGLIPGKDEPNGLGKKVGQHESIWLDEQGNDKRDTVFEAVKDVQSPNASMFTAETAATKNYHYVVVLAEFTDVKFELYQTPQYFKDQISGLGTRSTGTVSTSTMRCRTVNSYPTSKSSGPLLCPVPCMPTTTNCRVAKASPG